MNDDLYFDVNNSKNCTATDRAYTRYSCLILYVNGGVPEALEVLCILSEEIGLCLFTTITENKQNGGRNKKTETRATDMSVIMCKTDRGRVISLSSLPASGDTRTIKLIEYKPVRANKP